MIVKRDFIYSPKGKNRTLHIYLPDDCLTSGRRYPVMYFFDGHNLFSDADATYGKCWGLKEFLDGWDKDIIVVAPECGHEGNERLSEYLPYRGLLFCLHCRIRPMGRQTFDWIVGEIKPFIDREYPTLPDREHTAIGGSSMGGLMAICGGVQYNAYFSKAACVSSATLFCMRDLMACLKPAAVAPGTRFYLSWGTEEAYKIRDKRQEDRHSKTYQQNKRIADALKQKGAEVQMYCQVGGKHCEADWEKQLPRIMNFLWK